RAVVRVVQTAVERAVVDDEVATEHPPDLVTHLFADALVVAHARSQELLGGHRAGDATRTRVRPSGHLAGRRRLRGGRGRQWLRRGRGRRRLRGGRGRQWLRRGRGRRRTGR